MGDRIQIPAGEDKAFIVEEDAALQPIGSWRSSCHNKDVPDGVGRGLTRFPVSPSHPLQLRLSVEAD
jgi:hypothetical protein